MKKKIIKLLILLIDLTVCILIIKSTYSKYANSAHSTITEKVGAWIVKINGIDITENNGMFEIDNFVLDENSAVNSHVKGNQMAPGTMGRFYINLDPTGTDVSLKYKITIDTHQFISNILTDIGLNPNLEENRNKINISVNSVKINNIPVDIPADEENGQVTISKIKRLQAIKSEQVNERIDAIEVVIKWEDYRENDKTDSIIGHLKDYKLKLPIKINAIQWGDDLKFSSFNKLSKEDCEEYTGLGYISNYNHLYGGNNNQLQYDSDGYLKLDADNPVLFCNITSGNKMFDEEYSANFTIKGTINKTSDPDFPCTIFSIGEKNYSYLAWIGVYKGYLHIYSFRDSSSLDRVNRNYTEPGFLSYKISEFDNKILNIQVIARRTGETDVYLNGEKVTSFQSGGASVNCTHATIGDLRPLRGLKFVGTIYDFAMYDRVLTEEEIQANWLDVQERIIYK